MSRLSLLWFILSTFEEYFQIIWSLFPYLYCKVKCFQENESFEVKKGPFKYLWTLFFYTQDSLVCWFLVFSMKMSQKNTQNVLEMSNYCVSQATIVDVWNVVLQIIIQIILHYFNLLFTHIICDIFETIFGWKPDIML